MSKTNRSRTLSAKSASTGDRATTSASRCCPKEANKPNNWPTAGPCCFECKPARSPLPATQAVFAFAAPFRTSIRRRVRHISCLSRTPTTGDCLSILGGPVSCFGRKCRYSVEHKSPACPGPTPVGNDAHTKAAAIPGRHNKGQKTTAPMTRILIIDDQSTSRQILEELVASLGERGTTDSFADPRDAPACA